MPKKKKSPTDRIPVAPDIRLLVLHESGYKCANPVCRHVLTLDVHHLEYVSNGGTNTADNLLPLCPNCHALHHRGEIPETSLRAWKLFLLALNEAFDRKSVDVLLAIHKQDRINRLTGDGVIALSPLIAAGLVGVFEYWEGASTAEYTRQYGVGLSEKGKRLIEGWKAGDQKAAFLNPPSEPTITPTS